MPRYLVNIGFVGALLAGPWGCGLDERELAQQSTVRVPQRVPTIGTQILDGNPTATASAVSVAPTQSDSGPGAPGISNEGTMPGGDDAGGEAPVVAARCPDLDANDVLDCDETILGNAGFDSNTNGWEAEPEVSGSWEANDARERGDSGSALVRYQLVIDSDAKGFGGVFQCLAAQLKGRYQLGAQVWIPAQQGDGSSGVQVLFMPEPNCGGLPLGSAIAATSALEEWHVVNTQFDVPEGTVSLKIRLGSVKPFRDESFAALVDNVLLRER